VNSMYEDARTSMRCSIDNTGTFEIRVGVHQVSSAVYHSYGCNIEKC